MICKNGRIYLSANVSEVKCLILIVPTKIQEDAMNLEGIMERHHADKLETNRQLGKGT